MRFLAAEIRSFTRFIKPFTLPLDQQGLVLVEGRNLDNGGAFDSNGAGKSTLFEAIKWCLFGKMSRYGDERLGSEEVTWEGHDADVLVFFQNSRGNFRVHRQRGIKGAPRLSIASLQNQEWRPLVGSGVHAAEGTESVVNILGFDYQTLRYALTLEGTSLDIASEGFATQMKILESILRFDIYTEAQKIAKTDAAGKYAAVTQLIEEMDRQELILRQAQGMKKDLETLDEAPRERELDNLIASLKVALAGKSALDRKLTKQRASTELAVQHATEQRLALAHVRLRIENLRELEESVTSAGSPIDCEHCGQTVTKKHVKTVLARAEQESVDAERAYNQVKAQRDRAQEALLELEGKVSVLKDQQRECEQAETELADLLARKAKRLKVIAAHDAKAEDAERTVARLTDEVSDSRRVHKRAESWAVHGFPTLKEHTLDAATPVLNAAASRYAQILSDGAISVVFNTIREARRDKLILASGETGPTYESMSNGEKRRTQIIVALSLRALARWRIAEPLAMSVFDEVFDGLDESGLNRMMQILQQDTDELSSVYVVTHNPTLKALFPGARTLRVVREHGASRVEGL